MFYYPKGMRQMNVWAITDVGAVRQQNQDAYRVETLSPEQALLVLCDGMGGARAGNVASELAVQNFGDIILNALHSDEKPEDPAVLLEEAVARSNQAVYQRASEDPDCAGMGTTLVAALVDRDTCHIVNVGDSRAYAINEEGIRRVTRDHSLVEDLVQHGDITPEQARNHPQKNLITRALGAESSTKADLFRQPYVSGSFLLLCSDGLSNVMTDQEILYEVIHGGEPCDCCKRLLNITLSRGAPDNVTVVLLQM